MAHSLRVCLLDVHQLASIVRNHIDNVLILDSRSFLEYNSSHVVNAINVGCAKLMKRRLQQEKLSIEDFLAQNCHWEVDRNIDIIVYDQSSQDAKFLPPDSFISVFLQKLLPVYHSVSIIKGGFLEFQSAYPDLCENERAKFTPLTSLSQPCLPITNHGPTKILPFLFLGSQHDALNRDALENFNITYQLNVSTNCPKPDFIQDSHFMRIPVIDNYSEKLLPHFAKAFQFLDKVRESGGCVLVHCLAGISRSATVAIAYVMKSLRMTSDDAYRYVKAKRATISPNFNFLGQLLEYEKQLQRDCILKLKSETAATPFFTSSHSPARHFQSISGQASVADTILCSIEDSVSDGFCTKYAQLAEKKSCVMKSSSSSQVKETFSMFEKPVKKFGSIPCKQASLNIKCLPVSSLKELNFTPCQASLRSPVSKNFMKSSSISPTKISGNTSDYNSSPEFNSMKPFEFSSKSYIRSDSASTSGLGSEGSDCADSWNDYSRESDILMDEDFLTVPTEDDELRRNKMLGFEDSYEDSVSLYPKYRTMCIDFGHRMQREADNSQAVPSKNEKPTTTRASSAKPTALPSHLACDSDFRRSQLLYRAQSCPGILISDSAGVFPEKCPGNVTLRKPKTTKLKRDEARNRFSCSSIDYMDYSNSFVSYESCPDALNLPTNPNRSSSSHCNYRHSMIQVS